MTTSTELLQALKTARSAAHTTIDREFDRLEGMMDAITPDPQPLPMPDSYWQPTERLNFRSEPVVASRTYIRTLDVHERLGRVGQSGAWYKLLDASNRAGWAHSAYLKAWRELRTVITRLGSTISDPWRYTVREANLARDLRAQAWMVISEGDAGDETIRLLNEAAIAATGVPMSILIRPLMQFDRHLTADEIWHRFARGAAPLVASCQQRGIPVELVALNEPNLHGPNNREGWGVQWETPTEAGSTWLALARRAHQEWPGARLHWPAVSPGGDYQADGLVRRDHIAFLDEAEWAPRAAVKEGIRVAIDVHGYIQEPAQIEGAFKAHLVEQTTRFADFDSFWVTEFSNTNRATPKETKGHHILAMFNVIRSIHAPIDAAIVYTGAASSDYYNEALIDSPMVQIIGSRPVGG